MAWKEVPSSFGDPWKPEKKNQELIGHYLGTAEIPFEGRTFLSYRFRNPEGRIINCAGGMLSSKMDQVQPGTLCRVVFKGLVKTKSGPAKDFDVQIDAGADLLDAVSVARANAAHDANGELGNADQLGVDFA
jgi:hypothetical protein